jgi:predicted P-loop ATPase
MIAEPKEMIEEDAVEEMAEEDALTEEDVLLNPAEESAEAVEEQRQYALAFEKIKALIKECADGVSDRKAEALGLAKRWPKLVEFTELGFAKARSDCAKAAPQGSKDYGGLDRLRRNAPPLIEGKAVETSWAPFASPPTQPEGVAQPEEEEPEPKPEPKVAQSKVEAVGPPTVAGLVLRRADPPISFFQQSKSPTGIPPSYENAIVALKAMELDCRYDVFHNKVIVQGYESYTNGDVTEDLDNTLLKLREQVLRRYGFDAGKEFLIDALKTECFNHIFDPVRDYLDGLRWDGVPRVDRWLIDYCGAEDTPLNRAFGRKVLMAGVRRVRKPGCKFDYVLVLEGPQGIGKSTMLRILAGDENFSDSEILGDEKREQQEAVQGVWIYEISELEGMRKADVTHIKLFISKTHDKARPAYGRNRVDRPRRCIFIATTNEKNYLRDSTGNRRFWPVKVLRIDLDAIARDRDQLWAEASVLEATGETLVIDETLWSAAAEQQSGRLEHDPWEDPILTWISTRQSAYKHPAAEDGTFARTLTPDGDNEWRISSTCLFNHVLTIPTERQTDAASKRLTKVMEALGWQRPKDPIRIGNRTCRAFTFVEPRDASGPK